jgi:hypothetical protein
MAQIQRPPSDITPNEFFESWLPGQAAAHLGAATAMTVRVRLKGEGGGGWDLRLGPEGLAVGAPSDAEAEVTLVQSVADWRAIVVGEPGQVSLAPAQARPTDILFLDPVARDVVKQVAGTIRFEVTGYNGRTWSLTVKIGTRPARPTPPGSDASDAMPADATISVDAETYAAMLARVLPPPAAYFQGKIRIVGDVQLAMQLGMALMPRFS